MYREYPIPKSEKPSLLSPRHWKVHWPQNSLRLLSLHPAFSIIFWKTEHSVLAVSWDLNGNQTQPISTYLPEGESYNIELCGIDNTSIKRLWLNGKERMLNSITNQYRGHDAVNQLRSILTQYGIPDANSSDFIKYCESSIILQGNQTRIDVDCIDTFGHKTSVPLTLQNRDRLFNPEFYPTQECEVLKHLTFKYSKNKYLRCFM